MRRVELAHHHICVGDGERTAAPITARSWIGAGGIGRTHARTYKANPIADLVAICDQDHARADAAASEFGIRAYYDVATMLASENIDMV
jgi:predicted dinucleotide-utilizing enzyme